MSWRFAAAITVAMMLSACGSDGPTAPTRTASLNVVVSPNPLPAVAVGEVIVFDVTLSETAGVGVQLITDSARLVDASGNELPGALGLCYSGAGCLPVHILHYLSFQIRNRALKVVSTPPDRLEYTINAVDDNNHYLSVSVKVPIQ